MLMIAALLLTSLCFLGGRQPGLTAFRWGFGKCTTTKLRVFSSSSVGGHYGAEGEDGIGGNHLHDLMPYTNPRIELSALHHNLIGGSSSSSDFLSLRFFSGLLTNSTIHTVGYESKVISSEFESDSQHSVRVLSSFSNPQFSSVDGAALSTAPLLDIKESLTIYYLEQELKLSKETLTKIILKYSWILYLKVDTNLRPTIEVMKSFGLKDRDVRLIVSKAPSVLAINYDFTLPEKLIALQKMFFLSRINLSKVLVSQPYLLTSSIGRNLKIATFLSKNMKLSERQIKALIVKDPRIGMSNLSVLSRCWSALIDLYGLSRSQAQSMVLRYPYLMSFKLLKDIKQRLEFFCSELHLSPPPAVGDIQLLAYRFPQLLFMDVDVFLRPNAIILKTYLQLDTTSQLLSLLKIFPQLLGYNPITLRKLCERAIRLLTGRSDLLMDNDDCQPQSTAGSDGYSLSYSFPAFQQLEEKFPSVFNDSVTDSAVDGLDDEGSSMDAELLLSEMKSSDLAINPYLESDIAIDCSRDSHEVVLIDDFEADRLLQLTNASIVSASDWVHSVRSINPRDVAAEFDLIDDIVEDSVADQQLLSSPLIESHPECSQSRELTFPPLEIGSLSGNMTKDMPALGSSESSSHLEAVSLLAQSAAYLEIAPERALHMLRTSPWILAYRTARSQGVLSALMVSLGLSRAELTKCVVTYPRLLSLSLEGKLSAVLRAIAVAARKYLRRNPNHKLKTSSKFIYSSADFQHNPPLSNLSSQLSSLVLLKDALTARRNDNVRCLVRELVVRYPLILGTAMPRIAERMDAADRAAVEWSSYLAVLRRSPDAHSKWMETIEADLLRRSEMSSGSYPAAITLKQTKKKPVSMARVEPVVDKVMVKKNVTTLPHVKSTQGMRVEKTRTYSTLRLKLKRVSRRIDGRYQVTK